LTLEEALQVPGRMRVFLDAAFNAIATEPLGLFGLIGTQGVS
jgi:hypothetical protein